MTNEERFDLEQMILGLWVTVGLNRDDLARIEALEILLKEG